MRIFCSYLLLLALMQASFAQCELEGELCDTTLGPGICHVTGGIWIAEGCTVRVLPATILVFDGSFALNVQGTLLAEGTESDSIVFTTDTVANPLRWGGIFFDGGSSSGSRMAYCRMEYCGLFDAVISCDRSAPEFRHCMMRGSVYYGVVLESSSSAIFAYCSISDNSDGGVYCERCSLRFEFCTISDNLGTFAGGFVCEESSLDFVNCTFQRNSTGIEGGALLIWDESSVTLTNCTISDNFAERGGAGIYCEDSYLSAANCTVSGNIAGGLLCDESWVNLVDCNFTENSAPYGGGYAARDESSVLMSRCDFSGNSATISGGAVYCDGSSLQLGESIFSGNSAGFSGGALGGEDCSGYSEGCTFDSNTASNGGAVHFYDASSLDFVNCTFTSDSTTGLFGIGGVGGAVWCEACTVSFAGCIFQANSADSGLEARGGAAYCRATVPHFYQCTFSNNSAIWGGALHFENCEEDPLRPMDFSTFSGNFAYEGGGGIYFYESSPVVIGCMMRENEAGSLGGGVLCDYNSSPSFRNCQFKGNAALSGGGAICRDAPTPSFAQCVFDSNSATNGGALACYSHSSPDLVNCTLARNFGGGVWLDDSSPTLTNTIVAFNQGLGIYFCESEASQTKYCDFFGNGEGDFSFCDDDSSQGPPGIGRKVTFNANGDSCDVFWNIYVDPNFRNVAEQDYHLMWTSCEDSVDSPCIDAGDPTIHDRILDCDWGLGTPVSDMGAYGGDSVVAGISYPDHPTQPAEFRLFQNWPNPFNSTTVIRYDVPQAGKVNLTIFNLLGQKVATVFDGQQLAGTHTISWNANNLPSGLYFCRIDAAGFAQTRKMQLVK